MIQFPEIFIDFHMHSTESDGTKTPEEILKIFSEKAGIKIFSLTDHDTISGVEKIEKIIPADIFLTRKMQKFKKFWSREEIFIKINLKFD